MHTMEGQFRADLAIATNTVQYDLYQHVNRTQVNLARHREKSPDDKFTLFGTGSNPTRRTALEHNPVMLTQEEMIARANKTLGQQVADAEQATREREQKQMDESVAALSASLERARERKLQKQIDSMYECVGLEPPSYLRRRRAAEDE